MDDIPTKGKTPTTLFLIFDILIILINVLLIRPILKKDKISAPEKVVSIYLLVGGILSCCYLGLRYFVYYIYYYDDYEAVDYAYYSAYLLTGLFPFYSLPLQFSAFNLIIYSFAELTNNNCILSSTKRTITIFTLITWLPSLLCLIFILSINSLLYLWSKLFIGIISCIICIIILIYVCCLKVEQNESLQISKKKATCKLVTYIIIVLLFCLFEFMISEYNMLGEYYYLYVFTFLCLVLLVVEYIFLWDQSLKKAILMSYYFCKTSEEINSMLDNTNELMQIGDNN